jgi:hypothetical protein
MPNFFGLYFLIFNTCIKIKKNWPSQLMLPLRRVLMGDLFMVPLWKIKNFLVLCFSENNKQDLDIWPLLQNIKDNND